MSEKTLLAFGTKVRKLRESIGLSQESFASRIGLHRTYIGSVERGERNVGLLNIVRFAKGLGVKPSDLLSDVDGGKR
jgi:transcriptional regulator with XRE-family HTH domain